MHNQIIDEVDDRVPESEHGLEIELDDDLRDLKASVALLATRTLTVDAIEKHDAKAAEASGQMLAEAYPGTDYVFFDATGKLIADIGCADALAQLPKAMMDAAKTGVFAAVLEHGCEASTSAPAAYVVVRPAGTSGFVLGCIPFDLDYVHNARDKLGVELAFIDPKGKLVTASSDFPADHFADAQRQPSLLNRGEQMWALGLAAPGPLATTDGGYHIAIALNVTDIRNIVIRNITIAALALLLATAISVFIGTRVASVMSRALSRVNAAFGKLGEQNYVKVDAIRTGDELESLADGFNSMVDGLQERDKLKNTFGKYMTQSVMDHLMSGKVQLGGQTLKVTILFSDIRGFTSISEKMDAQELVGLLNEYFTEMVGIIMEEDGVVDKYIGDAVMAVFGAPVPKPDDAVRAVRAAIRMRQELVKLNERLAARGIPALKTGIGLHTGEVVAGNIGSEKRMEYTVIGDAVNLASRLESNTKELGVNILISEDTYNLVKDTCKAHAVKEITVKGRKQPVMTYAVDAGDNVEGSAKKDAEKDA